MIPRLTTLTAMVIASMVTCTDPILSQAIAKGPFADKYVPRALREIISAEAGANDGFGFPFLLLATFLIRHTPVDDVDFKPDAHRIIGRSGDVGRLGGDAGKAIEIWVVEGWLYFILLGAVIGVVIGIASMSAITFTLTRFVFSTTPSSPLAHMLTCRAADGSTPSPCSSIPPHSACS
jgi:NhaP-type Na+/H+ or K+/H+ antiporter